MIPEPPSAPCRRTVSPTLHRIVVAAANTFRFRLSPAPPTATNRSVASSSSFFSCASDVACSAGTEVSLSPSSSRLADCNQRLPSVLRQTTHQLDAPPRSTFLAAVLVIRVRLHLDSTQEVLERKLVVAESQRPHRPEGRGQDAAHLIVYAVSPARQTAPESQLCRTMTCPSAVRD